MKILVTGAGGQLGSEINAIKGEMAGVEFFFTDVPVMDITDYNCVSSFVKSNNIDAIINCAAYTNVDKAESDRELSMAINSTGAGVLASVAAENNATLVHISTDYVFDGNACKPYTEDVKTNPVGAYGATKLSGEQEVINSGCKGVIIRTSWLYSSFGNNFVKTMLRLGSERESLNVVFDQVGTPTYARDLARTVLSLLPQLASAPRYGEVYHFSNEGVCSWYDFAVRIMKLSGKDCIVSPIEAKEYPTPTSRPHYSVLNKAKIKKEFAITIPHWEESLVSCLKEMGVFNG